MAHRVLALNLVSGHNLKDVNVFSRMEVYAIVSIYGDPRTRQRTKTDRDGARHPTWDTDDTLWFTAPPTAAAASASGACLHVLLRTERLFGFGDRDVGEVFIPLADLLAGACASGGATASQCASFQVRKVNSSERRGKLSVSYRFGPVMAPILPVPDRQRWPLGQLLPAAAMAELPSSIMSSHVARRRLQGNAVLGDMDKSSHVDAGHGVAAGGYRRVAF